MPSESDYIDPQPIAENARLTEAALEEKAEKDLSNLDATVLGQKIIAAVKAGKLTADDLGAVAKTLIGAAGGVAALGADGKVPTTQLPAMDYDAKGSASAVQSNLNTHVQDTTAHITSAERTKWNGAAAGEHKHSASDITSGTLPVARGGTGVSVLTGTDYGTYRVRGAAILANVPTSMANGQIAFVCTATEDV